MAANDTSLKDYLLSEIGWLPSGPTADQLMQSISTWMVHNSAKYHYFGDEDPCQCGEHNPESAIDNLAHAIQYGQVVVSHSSCTDEDSDDDEDDDDDDDDTDTKNRINSMKTLQQLLMKELGTDQADVAEAVADIVFDWLDRLERNGRISMAGGWRGVAEEARRIENRDGTGR